MKVLITGGAGFIGSNFIHYWLEKYPDDYIVNLDVLTYAGNLNNLKSIEDNPRYSFVQADITDQQAVDNAMQGVELVVHFAAESHVDRSIMDPAIFTRTNVLGTQILCESALKNNVKHFHYVNTDEVYGSLPNHKSIKFTEQTKFHTRSPYSASKAGGEHIVNAYHVTFGLNTTITSCANNFGPYHHPEKMIPLFIINLLDDKKVPIYGDGQQIRDWLYVKDHCRAIDLVIKQGTIGEVYLVGAQLEHEITNLELTQKLLNLLDKDESYIEYVPDRPGHDTRYAIDWSKIAQLGWKPEFDFDIWLEKTVQWYKDNQDWWQPIVDGDYKDYYQKNYTKR